MKVAAIQLDAVFADVGANLKRVSDLVLYAVNDGAGLVVLPEFFTSAIGFSSKMLDVALQGKKTHEFLVQLSSQFNVIVGGSYLSFDGYHCYNLFELVFPDGNTFTHKKDLPTQFENCYYTKGDTNHILHTPIGEIGVALCWEMIRYDTVRNLSGKADIILAGSCWWDLPDDALPERETLRHYNQQLALETPVHFAKLLHIPVIHANHCGKVTAYKFSGVKNNSPIESELQTRQMVGATQIISSEEEIISRRTFHEGEGIVTADLTWGKTVNKEAAMDMNKYWIPDLPESYVKAWETINPQGEKYYNSLSLPYYHRNYKVYG